MPQALGDAVAVVAKRLLLFTVGVSASLLKASARAFYGLICDLLKEIKFLRKSFCVAGDLLQVVEERKTCISMQRVSALDGLSPRSNCVRSLDIGEEVYASHRVGFLAYGRPWWGPHTLPGAVKLIDGSWVDCRELPAPSIALLDTDYNSRKQTCSGWCSLLASIKVLDADRDHQYIVCKEHLDVQESCSLNSPMVRTCRRGEIIRARRVAIFYHMSKSNKHKTWVMRLQMDDGTWTTGGRSNLGYALSDSHYHMPVSSRELSAGPRVRNILAHIRYLEEEVATFRKSYQVNVAMCGLNAMLPCMLINDEVDFRERKLAGLRLELVRLEEILSSGTLGDFTAIPPSSEPQSLEQKSVFEPLDTLFEDLFIPLGHIMAETLRVLRGGSCSEGPRCFLPRRMLWTSQSNAALIESLGVDSTVVNAFGQLIKVASVQVHEEALCDLLELRTREAMLTVTATHRVVIPNEVGKIGNVKHAVDFVNNDLVFCGRYAVPLVKVATYKKRTRVVEMTFVPNDPVESFIAPKWSVLTTGQDYWDDTDDGF